MVRAAQGSEPDGFKVLWAHFRSDGCGEAHVQAPDGSICHLTWIRTDALYFEDVPIVEQVEHLPFMSNEEADDLRERFPDLWESARHWEHHWEPAHHYFPDLEQQWAAWKAGHQVAERPTWPPEEGSTGYTVRFPRS